jgi:hypothetical protein
MFRGCLHFLFILYQFVVQSMVDIVLDEGLATLEIEWMLQVLVLVDTALFVEILDLLHN